MGKIRECMDSVYAEKWPREENKKKHQQRQNQMKSPNNNHKCLTRIECAVVTTAIRKENIQIISLVSAGATKVTEIHTH